MRTIPYSTEIAEAIHDHLKAHGLTYSFDQDTGKFSFYAGVQSKVKILVYHIYVYKHGFTVSTRYPMGPSSDEVAYMDTLMRFLTRVNYGLRNGNFELDTSDGELNYKIFCTCKGLYAPTDEMIKESIYCSAAMIERFEPGILGILFYDMTADEAYDACDDEPHSIPPHLEILKTSPEALELIDSPGIDPAEQDDPVLDELLRILEEDSEGREEDQLVFEATEATENAALEEESASDDQ